MKSTDYPFAALVGQEPLKSSLLLNAIDPGIGGVLIAGEKGTAKSTAARALADLLPFIQRVKGCPFQCGAADAQECSHCQAAAERTLEEAPVPFVDLPLGATEDRVLGSLDFERALREGRRCLHPGLLATAHRGILYIDEVNLLPDHLVDVLLDVCAMGVNIVQREGVEIRHRSRFILVGTMNPEEGELRPQFLDRFGLMVTVAGPRDPEVRSEIVRRRLAFEADAVRFAEKWATDQGELRSRIVQARQVLPSVTQSDSIVSFISRLCCEMDVAGLRADIVLLNTARALAAWHGRVDVTIEDVRAAAELVLPHRRRRRPFDKPGIDQQQLDQFFDGPQGNAGKETKRQEEREPRQQGETQTSGPSGAKEVFVPSVPQSVRRIEMADAARNVLSQGRRNATGTNGRGGYVRAVADRSPNDIAVGATIRAAAGRCLAADGRVQVLPEDLHRKERNGQSGTLLLFVVDGSGSMAAKRRMEAVKGAVLGLLQSAYEQRDHVAVISFRGPEAEVVLPPTRSVETAEAALHGLPTGGRTPLAHALVRAKELMDRHRRTQPGLPMLLILLTDGRANVCLPGSAADPWRQALDAAEALAGTAALVFDTETGVMRSGRPKLLAASLGAECLSLEELSAESVLQVARTKLGTR